MPCQPVLTDLALTVWRSSGGGVRVDLNMLNVKLNQAWNINLALSSVNYYVQLVTSSVSP